MLTGWPNGSKIFQHDIRQYWNLPKSLACARAWALQCWTGWPNGPILHENKENVQLMWDKSVGMHEEYVQYAWYRRESVCESVWMQMERDWEKICETIRVTIAREMLHLRSFPRHNAWAMTMYLCRSLIDMSQWTSCFTCLLTNGNKQRLVSCSATEFRHEKWDHC